MAVAHAAVVTLEDLHLAILELRAEVRQLSKATHVSHSLSRADRELLSRLLPVLGATFGSEWFTAREACDHSSAGLRLVLDGISPRALGRLFKRAVGVSVDAYVVQHGGSELNVQLWRVVTLT